MITVTVVLLGLGYLLADRHLPLWLARTRRAPRPSLLDKVLAMVGGPRTDP